MNIKLALLSLALVVAAPVTSLAQILEPIPGKIGNVTISLTQTSDEWTEKRVKETDTVIQDVYEGKIVKAKYGNKEFITALLAEEILPSGPVADWSLKYVEIGNSKRFGGIFAVKKDGTVVNVSEGLDARTKGNYAESGKQTYTQTLSEGETISESYKGRYKETSTVVVELYTGNDDGISLHGVANESGTYDETYSELELSDDEKYTKGAVTYTGLSGGDEDEGPIFTGSISISALKDTADVSAFMSSFN
jgi:hypothetical protein